MTYLRLAVTAVLVVNSVAAEILPPLRTREPGKNLQKNFEPGQGLCCLATSAAEKTAEKTLWPTECTPYYTRHKAPGAEAASQNTTANLNEAAIRVLELRQDTKK